MADKVYIACDLGAESGRAIAGIFNGDTLQLEVAHRFLNTPLALPNALYWNLGNLYAEILAGIGIIAKQHGDAVQSVGVDTWGVDFGLLGSDGALVANPMHYRDPRNEAAFTELRAKVGDDLIYGATGIQFMRFNTIFQLYAMTTSVPEVLAAARCLLFMPDLIHYYLSGVKAAEATIASTGALLDPHTGSWARDLLDRCGIPHHFLPDLVQPGTVLGALRESVAFDTGAGPIKVVTPGSHDTASAVAAVPATNTDEFIYMSSGTWSLMGVELKEPLVTQRTQQLNFTNEGGVEKTIRFLHNIMGLWLIQECRRAYERDGEVYDYATLVQLALEAEPFRSIVDPDNSEFIAPRDMRRAIAEFCQRTGQPAPETPGQFVRCCMESLALRYRWVVEQLRDLFGKPYTTLHIVGGGTQNRALCQFTADATGCDVIAGPIEATAAGNLLMQMIAMGDVRNLSEGRELIRRSSEIIHYAPGSREPWDAAYERFIRFGG